MYDRFYYFKASTGSYIVVNVNWYKDILRMIFEKCFFCNFLLVQNESFNINENKFNYTFSYGILMRFIQSIKVMKN